MPRHRRSLRLALGVLLAFTLAAAGAPVQASADDPGTPSWSFLDTLETFAAHAYEVVTGHLPTVGGASPPDGAGGNPHDDQDGRGGESPHMDPDGVDARFF